MNNKNEIKFIHNQNLESLKAQHLYYSNTILIQRMIRGFTKKGKSSTIRKRLKNMYYNKRFEEGQDPYTQFTYLLNKALPTLKPIIIKVRGKPVISRLALVTKRFSEFLKYLLKETYSTNNTDKLENKIKDTIIKAGSSSLLHKVRGKGFVISYTQKRFKKDKKQKDVLENKLLLNIAIEEKLKEEIIVKYRIKLIQERGDQRFHRMKPYLDTHPTLLRKRQILLKYQRHILEHKYLNTTEDKNKLYEYIRKERQYNKV